MKKLMKAAVMNTVGKLEFESRPIPDIGPDDVLLKVDFVGVCGSDMALFEHGYIGASHVTEPIVLGHEVSGTVVKTGERVRTLKVGDRVAAEPGISCMRCNLCKSGKYNLCREVRFWASLPIVEGAFQEYVKHPAELCFALPSHVSSLEGALIEPLAVGMHALFQSGASLGSTAIILGAGCIGLSTMLSLKAAGIHDIYMVDIMDNRLKKAAELGALVFNPREDEHFIEALLQRTDGGGDYVFETAGNAVTIAQTIPLTKKGGTITLVGYTQSGKAEIDVNKLIDNELSVKTVFRYRNLFPKVISAVASGAIAPKKIASHIFPFSDIQKGMDYAIHHKHEVIKSVISFDGEEGN